MTTVDWEMFALKIFHVIIAYVLFNVVKLIRVKKTFALILWTISKKIYLRKFLDLRYIILHLMACMIQDINTFWRSSARAALKMSLALTPNNWKEKTVELMPACQQQASPPVLYLLHNHVQSNGAHTPRLVLQTDDKRPWSSLQSNRHQLS